MRLLQTCKAGQTFSIDSRWSPKQSMEHPFVRCSAAVSKNRISPQTKDTGCLQVVSSLKWVSCSTGIQMPTPGGSHTSVFDLLRHSSRDRSRVRQKSRFTIRQTDRRHGHATSKADDPKAIATCCAIQTVRVARYVWARCLITQSYFYRHPTQLSSIHRQGTMLDGL